MAVMWRFRARIIAIRPVAFSLCIAIMTTPLYAQWPQWGGPNRDFVIQGQQLSTTWPESGPPVLWKRSLGPGESSILVRGDLLFTMYGEDQREVVVAVNAVSGATVWEHRYKISQCGLDQQYGTGPRATPVIHEDSIE